MIEAGFGAAKRQRTRGPLVSVLVNNYNYGRFVGAAIDSALAQTYPKTEVVVVDDGSTDDSREIIASYGDRIMPVLKENGGQASAFNAGFAASRGEWICFLDSDDTFLPSKAETIVRLAEEGPAVDFIAHNLAYCRIDGSATGSAQLSIRESKVVDDRKQVRRGNLTAHLPSTSGLCFRRDLLREILPMPDEIRITGDNYIKAVALALTPVLLVPESLGWQRIHDKNLFTTSCVDANESALLYSTRVVAQIAFHLKRRHPLLARLVWKQHGHNLYRLRSMRWRSSRELRREIRSRFKVMEFSPWCLYCVAGAFSKDLVSGFLNGKTNRLFRSETHHPGASVKVDIR